MQRVYPEHIGNFKIGGFAVLAIGVNHEFIIAPVKPGGHAVIGKARIVEASQHGISGRYLHGEVVVGALPQFVFSRVTTATSV